MGRDSKTCIRVRSGADNCIIDDVVAIIPEDSDRSLVDTAAKNTVVKKSRLIAIAKIATKGKRKYFFLPIALSILGVLADIVTLSTTGQNLWSFIHLSSK